MEDYDYNLSGSEGLSFRMNSRRVQVPLLRGKSYVRATKDVTLKVGGKVHEVLEVEGNKAFSIVTTCLVAEGEGGRNCLPDQTSIIRKDDEGRAFVVLHLLNEGEEDIEIVAGDVM